MPKFTVIIPSYNRARYLEEALRSVFSQTFTDFEVIVVDDGSTDDTRSVVSRYGGKIRYVFQANQGRSAARNAGLRLAEGEIVAFLDSDDRWLPDKLERQARYFESNGDIAMVHGHFDVIGETGAPLPELTSHVREVWSKAHARGETYENWALQCCCILSTVAIRAEALQQVGLFDSAILANEELDLYLRIAAQHRIGFIEQRELTHYRVHSSNSGSDNLAKGAVQVANKHLALLESIPFPVNRRQAKQNFQLSLSKSFFLLGDRQNGRRYFLKTAFTNPLAFLKSPYSRLFMASLLPDQLRGRITTLRKQLFPTPFERVTGGAPAGGREGMQ